MAQKVHCKIEGIEKVQKRLREFPQKVQRRVLRKGVNKATTPVLQTARRLAPLGDGLRPDGSPRDHLRKTLAKKLKTYTRTGAVVGIVGPKAKAAPHAKLVEGGTRPHDIVLSKPLTLGRVTLPAGFTIRHPGTKPVRFMERALETNKRKVQGILASELRSGIEREGKA